MPVPVVPRSAERAWLPPLPRTSAADEVPPGQRRAVIAAIAALHVLAGWAALQVPAVRAALEQAAPIFVDLIAPPAPPPPVPTPPPPPRPIPKTSPPAPLITATPSPAPAEFVAPPPPEVPVPPAPPIVVVEAPPAPSAAPDTPAPQPPPPPPKEIPASAIEYLEMPPIDYPRLSRRLNEAGVVIVRVYIDESGVPRMAQVAKSSGFARLDDAAVAGLQKFRFKPMTENGKPLAGWARIPVPFELER